MKQKPFYKVIYNSEDNSFYYGSELVGTCSYDRRQQKYIVKHIHKSYAKGYKFLYASSINGLALEIQKRINNFNKNY